MSLAVGYRIDENPTTGSLWSAAMEQEAGGTIVVRGVRYGVNGTWIKNTIRQQQHPSQRTGFGGTTDGVGIWA